MAEYKISDLPAVVTPLGTDLLEIEQTTSKKATITQITSIEATARASADTTLQTNINTEATSRANADTALQTDINNRLNKDGSVTSTATQNMGGFKILNVADPTLAQDAATKTYADLKLAKTGGTMSGAIAMGTNKITGLGDPSAAQDAMTLTYFQTNGWRVGGTLNTLGNDTSAIGSADNHDFLLKTNNTQIVKFGKDGKVGIGNFATIGNSPGSILDVQSYLLSNTTGYTLRICNSGDTSTYTETALRFDSALAGGSAEGSEAARIYSKFDNISAASNRLSFQINGGSGFVDVFSISAAAFSGGALGIGVTQPSEKLHLVGNQKTTGQVYQDKFTLTDAVTIALDWNNSNVQYVVLGGNRTFTFAHPKDGALYTLIIKQDGSGSRTLTWPATIAWGGGSAPTLTITADKVDVIQFVYDGTNTKYYDTAIKLNH